MSWKCFQVDSDVSKYLSNYRQKIVYPKPEIIARRSSNSGNGIKGVALTLMTIFLKDFADWSS